MTEPDGRPSILAIVRWVFGLIAGILAALILSVRSILIFFFHRGLKPVIAAFDSMPFMRAGKAWIARQPPYVALGCVAFAAVLLTPATLLEIRLVAHDHVRMAIIVGLFMKLVGPLFVGQTWQAAKPQAIQIAWVAATLDYLLKIRHWSEQKLKNLPGYATARNLITRIKLRLQDWLNRR